MKSIEAMAADMERQLADLPALRLARPRGKVALVGLVVALALILFPFLWKE